MSDNNEDVIPQVTTENNCGLFVSRGGDYMEYEPRDIVEKALEMACLFITSNCQAFKDKTLNEVKNQFILDARTELISQAINKLEEESNE